MSVFSLLDKEEKTIYAENYSYILKYSFLTIIYVLFLWFVTHNFKLFYKPLFSNESFLLFYR